MASFAHLLIQLLVYVPIILLSVVLHELGHAWVSVWLGDRMPRIEGRLSMNPIHHFDASSLIFLLISGLFGGFFLVARPVRTSPESYRFPALGEFLVALAGPVVNVFCSLVLWPFFMLMGGLMAFERMYELFFIYCLAGIKINLYIALFNLLPIPPLDGSYIWLSFFPYQRFRHFRETITVYGMWILLFTFVALLVLPNSLIGKIILWVNHLSESVIHFWPVIRFPTGW